MRALTLRNIPEDVFKILVIEQGKEKIKKGKGVFGLEQTIYKVIREFDRCRKEEENKSK